MNFQGQNGKKATWIPKERNDLQWLQVDLQHEVDLSGISSQGRPSSTREQWVESYTVSYSKIGSYFIDFKQNCDIKVCVHQNIVEPNYSIYQEPRFLKQIVFKMSVIYPRLKSRKKYFLFLQNIFYNSKIVVIIFKIACEYEPFSALNWRGPPSWIDEVHGCSRSRPGCLFVSLVLKLLYFIMVKYKRTVVV